MIKAALRSLLAAAGLEIQRKRAPSVARHSLIGALSHARSLGWSPATVLDVGAAHGYFTRDCAAIFPAARCLLVEPLSEYATALHKIAAALHNAEVVSAAAAAKSGEVVINVHPDLVGSSLYHEQEGAQADGQPRTVRALRVDDLVAECGARGPFLFKVDVQGAELEVLRGAESTLTQTDYLVLEVSFFQFLQGAPQFADVVDYMKARGFAAYDIYGLSYRPLDGALAQADMVFVRENGLFRQQHLYYASAAQRQAQTQRFQTAHERSSIQKAP